MTKENKSIAVVDETSDLEKGANAGALFGHALAGSIDEVAGGAAQILGVAGHTVFGSVGKLAGTGVGGGVELVKAMFSKSRNVSIEQLEARNEYDMRVLELKNKQRARKEQLKNEAKMRRRVAKMQQQLAELSAFTQLPTDDDE